MLSRAEFQELVANAYQSLYDFVRLRSHPLASLLIDEATVSHKDRGWQLHHRLLEGVEELYPGAAAPPFSREWRRHRLMVLRYVEAMDPQAVADQLGISRRQYYREHAAAIEAVGNLLWERGSLSARELPPVADALTPAQADVMQVELARISQTDSYADLGEVLEGALAVLERMLEQNAIAVELNLPTDTPITSIGHNLLRQVTLGALGCLIDNAAQMTLVLTVTPGDATVRLRLHTDPPRHLNEDSVAGQLATFREMLRVGSAQIHLARDEGGQPVGFDLELPLEYDCTVLAVDDNEDTLALYKRCLTPNRYRVITTPSAQAVVRLAREARPDMIILDLMMPEQDGWDLLQELSNQSETAHVPIVICSVLKQKQLALSLGAADFLEKPFTEQGLLDTLEKLREGH